MKPQKTTIMIGLLGDKPKMGEKAEGGLLAEDKSSCPLATQDADINKGNMKKAILTANYGEKKDGEGKCKACEYFCTPKEMPDCGIEKDMGYCEVYDFVCGQNKGCDAWEAISKEEEEMEMEEE